MPCPDDRDESAETERWGRVILRLACETCRELESKSQPIPEYAQKFWEEHKRLDSQRTQ